MLRFNHRYHLTQSCNTMLKFVLILVGISLISHVNIEARTIQNETDLTLLKQSVLDLSLKLQSLNESLEKGKAKVSS